jgi:pyruvate dehydrogenase E2 component (dihydrolipoamide acetyltransferase)
MPQDVPDASANSMTEHFAAYGPIETSPLSRIQAATARAMVRNWATIPHVTHHDEVEITEPDRVIRGRRAAGGKHTLLAYLFKACVMALRDFPHFNASLDADGKMLILKRYVNIAFAVDTPQGLLTPVIRGCDEKAAEEIATEIEQVSSQAREKGLAYQQMEGGTFTISSLGGIGGTGFTPIINAPDVAILGVTRAQVRPVFEGNGVRPALMLPLSLSYDHRVINGADAARFVVAVGSHLVESCAE